MIKTLLIFFLLVLTGTGWATTISGSYVFEGELRDYQIYVPDVYDGSSAVPLVFNLHGYTSNAAAQQSYSMMDQVADTANFLICYPNGLDNTWNANFGLPQNDVGFISSLIDTLNNRYNIDLNKVYSCGMSNGGYMSYTLACELTDRIAAIASVTGTMNVFASNQCSPSRNIPIMQMHGTADQTVLYDGTGTAMGIEALVARWVGLNNAGLANTDAVPNISSTDGCTATRTDYIGSEPNSHVAFYKINGGEHTWPSASINIGVTNRDFHGSGEIWKFFRQYCLNAPVGNKPVHHPEFQRINYSNNRIQLRIPSEVQVYSMNGQQVYSGQKSRSHAINLPVGIYYIKAGHASKKFFAGQ